MKYAHFRIKADGTITYQSVKVHLEGTAVLSEQFASKIGMPKTGRLLGLLHDSGKLGPYQDYLKACEQYELGMIPALPRKGSVDHGVFGAAYVMKELGDEKDILSRLTAETLAMVLASHHGGLRDYLGPDVSTPLWSRIENYCKDKKQEYEDIKKEFETDFSADDVKKLFSESVSELKSLRERIAKFTKFQMHLAIKFLYSCLIDGDREDTRLFMEGKEPVREYRDWAEYGRRLEQFLGELREKKPKTASEGRIKMLREEISDACYKAGEWPAGVYKLTVPTGGGKTLASLRMALRHMERKDAAGSGHIVQVLPFTSIIEQNAAVVRNVLQCGGELLEHHSNVILEAEGEEEHNFSEEHYRLLTERWISPFIFTTTVQLLNTVYGAGTQNIRRLHNLANSVIIMDEVQALPLKTLKLFGEFINFLHLAGNSTILLCTATQPNLEKLSVGIQAEVKEIIPDVMRKFKEFQRMEVKDRTLKGGYETEAAADFIEEVKCGVNSLLVVMNTKRITREIYDILRKRADGETEVLYITTELCPAHRSDVIKHLKELLEQKKSVICVSTSVLEAGVDVSFEGVVRNLAGLDSIAQSSGRGNRHGENEENGITYIINVKDEKLGSMTEIAVGEEKTRAVLDTFRRRPEAYGNSLLSPLALSDYYEKYFKADDIESQMKYPLKDDSELSDLYSYFTSVGEKVLLGRYRGRVGEYKWKLTFPFETAGRKFRVIDQDTISILVPYKKGRDLISQLTAKREKVQLGELRKLVKAARPYFVSLYTSNIHVFQQAVAGSPVPGLLILKDGYYDEIVGLKEEQKLEFLSF